MANSRIHRIYLDKLKHPANAPISLKLLKLIVTLDQKDLKTILEYSFSLSNTLLSSRVAVIEIYFFDLESDR
ncbi:DUF2887 domain-containing protein [Dolichospermum sp. LEGE 00240]|uniref:DUF2887 domain-containing protein n=1 Tax=Dolichospermum sp. LEGE 00240 TaxID=1828603 RepID=UPI00187FAEDA|nr:DUF2887 domain-containing protein [Dolichospermum sp. LEGE 00240]